MEIELIGLKIVDGNLGQSITFFQLSDNDLDDCPGPIKIPNLFCTEREIGDKDLIAVSFQGKERQLFGILLGQRTTNDSKTVWFFPLERLVEELSCSPVLLESMITKGSNFVSDRSIHLGYNGIANPFLIQKFDKFAIEETRIGSDSDTVDPRGNLLETFFEKFRGT